MTKLYDYLKLKPKREEWEFLIAQCPWCRKTPCLNINYIQYTGGTWRWNILCYNLHCKIRPMTRLIAVRKTCKSDLQRQKQKIEKIVDEWNEMNPFSAYEKTVFYPHVR